MVTTPRSPLERALLRALADVGPNPTALDACPSAAFECNGISHRSAPGWWAVYACDTKITCEASPSADGSSVEEATLRFVPSGRGVMDGEPWTWRLAVMRTMAVGKADEATLLMLDSAPYPEPLRNLLPYHALVICRDVLCSRVAQALNARCDAAYEGRSLSGFALDLAWSALTAEAGAEPTAEVAGPAEAPVPPAPVRAELGYVPPPQEGGPGNTLSQPLPQFDDRRRSVVDLAARRRSSARLSASEPPPATAASSGASESHAAVARPVGGAAGTGLEGAGGTGLESLGENEVLVDFYAPGAGLGGGGLGMQSINFTQHAAAVEAQQGAATPPPGDAVAQENVGNAAAPIQKPWAEAPATAQLFSDFLSYRSPRAERAVPSGSPPPPPPAGLAAGAPAGPLVAPGAGFEDKLDALRARLPDRSSQELRQLLLRANGDANAVLSMFQSIQ